MKDNNTLREASEHIYYEWRMLNETADFWENAPEGYKKSAFIESFLIHCRNLVEFLFHNQNSDYLVAMYYTNKTWAPTKTALLKRWDIHKYVAHLTFYRNKGIVDWPVQDLRREINQLMHKFVETAQDDLINNNLRNYSKRPEDNPRP